MPRNIEISRPSRSNGRRGTFLLALVILLANGASSAAQGTRTPRVLLLFAIRNMAPTRETVETRFSRFLESTYGGAVDLQVEYLDLPDAEKNPYVEHITGLMAAKYGGQHFDAVVAHRTEALGYVLARRSQLFPGVPVVFLDIAPMSLKRLGPLPADVTGVQTIIDGEGSFASRSSCAPGRVRSRWSAAHRCSIAFRATSSVARCKRRRRRLTSCHSRVGRWMSN